MEEAKWEQRVTLTCCECGDYFNVSASVAEAMWYWQDASGDPLVCASCAGLDITDWEVLDGSNANSE